MATFADSMSQFVNSPMTMLGMGLLGGNYGANSKEAFANAMRGGLLGMQQAGVSQARQAQTQAYQQMLLMEQAAAKREKEEREQREQWISSLPAQEQAVARGNPQLYMEMRKAQIEQQYPGQTGFGTTVQYVYDRNLKQVLPAQASQAGGVFIVMPDGSKQPFDPARHELRKPFTMQNFGGFQAPFQPLSGQVGAGGGGAAGGGAGPIPQPIVPPFIDEQGNAPGLAQGEVLSPQSQYRPAGAPPGAIANTPKPEQDPGFQAAQTTAKEEAKLAVQKKAAKPKVRRSAMSMYRQNQNVQRAIEQARENTSMWTTGTIGATTSGMPFLPAHDLSKSLATVEANLGFDKLQSIKDNSPTGGALGQVSERELDLLKSAWASLAQSQSEPQFRDNLAAVEAQYKNSWAAVEKAYMEDYGEPLFPDGKPNLGAAGPSGGGMSLQQRALEELQKRQTGAR